MSREIAFSTTDACICAPGRYFVSLPTIVAGGSNSHSTCLVVSAGSLTYTCTNNGHTLTWTSSVWSGSFNVDADEFDKRSVPALRPRHNYMEWFLTAALL